MEELNSVVIKKCKITEDINHSFSPYVLSDLHVEQETKKGFEEILRSSQRFRQVHAEL